LSVVTDDCIDPQEMPFDATGRAIFKQVFVSDAEKRKSFQLHIKISVNDHVIGIFQSDPIKIVSKPSKKKQSTKNFERTTKTKNQKKFCSNTTSSLCALGQLGFLVQSSTIADGISRQSLPIYSYCNTGEHQVSVH